MLKFYQQLYQEISAFSSPTESDVELITFLKSFVAQNALDDFVKQKSKRSFPVLVELCGVVLMFTCAERVGCWGLYMRSFRLMMPYFFRYDHFNYARWGSVFIVEMDNLAKEVSDEFNKGNFVVKWNARKFNQVSPDHSLEWLSGIGKRGGCILGITKTTPAIIYVYRLLMKHTNHEDNEAPR